MRSSPLFRIEGVRGKGEEKGEGESDRERGKMVLHMSALPEVSWPKLRIELDDWLACSVGGVVSVMSMEWLFAVGEVEGV